VLHQCCPHRCSACPQTCNSSSSSSRRWLGGCRPHNRLLSPSPLLPPPLCTTSHPCFSGCHNLGPYTKAPADVAQCGKRRIQTALPRPQHCPAVPYNPDPGTLGYLTCWAPVSLAISCCARARSAASIWDTNSLRASTGVTVKGPTRLVSVPAPALACRRQAISDRQMFHNMQHREQK
jgi:hypothetical protein